MVRRQKEEAMDFAEILRLSQPFFQLLSALILLFTLLNASRMRRTKALDLSCNYQARYHETNWEDIRSVERGEISAETWYEKFWNLQLEQYQYWKMGYIPNDIFSYWMRLRQKEWAKNASLGAKTYREGWNRAKEYLSDPQFAGFMTRVFEGKLSLALKSRKTARI
jgi:hypothetical protein